MSVYGWAGAFCSPESLRDGDDETAILPNFGGHSARGKGALQCLTHISY